MIFLLSHWSEHHILRVDEYRLFEFFFQNATHTRNCVAQNSPFLIHCKCLSFAFIRVYIQFSADIVCSFFLNARLSSFENVPVLNVCLQLKSKLGLFKLCFTHFISFRKVYFNENGHFFFPKHSFKIARFISSCQFKKTQRLENIVSVSHL